jgi:hypothetical protein
MLAAYRPCRGGCREPGRLITSDAHLTYDVAMEGLSLWSEDSFLSIASRGSFLSIGSVGSALSIGSIGSAGSAFSIGSAGSLGSVMSAGAKASVLSAGTDGAILGKPGHRHAAAALAGTLLAITGGLILRRAWG